MVPPLGYGKFNMFFSLFEPFLKKSRACTWKKTCLPDAISTTTARLISTGNVSSYIREFSSKSLRHDRVQNWVEDAVEVIEKSFQITVLTLEWVMISLPETMKMWCCTMARWVSHLPSRVTRTNISLWAWNGDQQRKNETTTATAKQGMINDI